MAAAAEQRRNAEWQALLEQACAREAEELAAAPTLEEWLAANPMSDADAHYITEHGMPPCACHGGPLLRMPEGTLSPCSCALAVLAARRALPDHQRPT